MDVALAERIVENIMQTPALRLADRLQEGNIMFYLKNVETLEIKFFENEDDADGYRCEENGMGYDDYQGSFIIDGPWSKPKATQMIKEVSDD